MNLPMPLEKGTRVTLSYFATDFRGVVEDAIMFQDATVEGCPLQQSMFIHLEPSALATNLGNGLIWMLFDAEGNGVSMPYVFIKSVEEAPEVEQIDLARELAHYQTRAEKLEAFVRYVRDMPDTITRRSSLLKTLRRRATELLPIPDKE